MRYWAGVDRRDTELFASAFAPGAVLSLLGGKRVVRVSDLIASGNFGGDFEHTSHALTSQVIDVTGDTATADSFALAHLVPSTGPILVRGLRYQDVLARTESGWVITHREQTALWQYDATRVEPHLP
jgi:hypothetical protein